MDVRGRVGLFPFLFPGSPGPLKKARLDEAKVYLYATVGIASGET